MKFLVDAQLPPSLCRWLTEQGHEAVHVTQILSGEAPDIQVAALAAAQNMTLLTKDDDFVLRHRREGLRVVWIRIGNASNKSLITWLAPRWEGLIDALGADETLVELV